MTAHHQHQDGQRRLIDPHQFALHRVDRRTKLAPQTLVLVQSEHTLNGRQVLKAGLIEIQAGAQGTGFLEGIALGKFPGKAFDRGQVTERRLHDLGVSIDLFLIVLA